MTYLLQELFSEPVYGPDGMVGDVALDDADAPDQQPLLRANNQDADTNAWTTVPAQRTTKGE